MPLLQVKAPARRELTRHMADHGLSTSCPLYFHFLSVPVSKDCLKLIQLDQDSRNYVEAAHAVESTACPFINYPDNWSAVAAEWPPGQTRNVVRADELLINGKVFAKVQ